MDAIIVGGGIAGLCCAAELHARGKSFVIVEATDRVGGRIATDEVDGFKLDRGFQVFLTAYPEAKRVLDYAALQLREFEPGALVHVGGKLQRLSDPWRRPKHLLATAMSSAASLNDKMKIGDLRKHVCAGSIEDIYSRPELSTRDALVRFGFSDTIIHRFFQPFLGGVFLEHELATSTRMFEFVFRMFSEGSAAIPADGMQAIPKQIADGLPPDSIRLNSKVNNIEEQRVTLEDGEVLTAPAIVLATANPEACDLGEVEKRKGCGVTCIYFATDKAPIDEGILVLNGEKEGPINNLCFPNLVADSYAPAGKSLVSATVLGADHDDSIADDVKLQMATWFGGGTSTYRHLKTYRIPFALPSQAKLDPLQKSPFLRDGLYRCGDDCDTGSINGAMASGRRAAEALLASQRTSIDA